MPQRKTERDDPQATQTGQAGDAIASPASTSRKYNHQALIESSYGPGCLNNSEGKPSHQIIADFPMSHRCFLTFNRLLDYLKGCFSSHKDWREAVNKHGELPFDPELFTRGFFAARTALGYGTTRFTLLGGPKERGWTKAIAESKLGYLNHDPKTPQGQVHPFWAGFYEHQAANWDLRIEPAVKEAMRTFGKGRRQELKRKRDEPNDGSPRKRPSKKDTIKAQNNFVAAAMRRLVVSDQDGEKLPPDPVEPVEPAEPAERTEPAARNQQPSAQANPVSSISQDLPAVNLEMGHGLSNVSGASVFDPLAFMYTPEAHSKPQERPTKIDRQAARVARDASGPKSSTLDGKAFSEIAQVYTNVSSDGHESDTSDDDDIEADPRKTPSKIRGGLAVPQALSNTAKLSADSGSTTEPTSPPTMTRAVKSEADSPAKTPNSISVTPTKTMPNARGNLVVAAPPVTPRRSTRLARNPNDLKSMRRCRYPAETRDGNESDSSVTVGFPTPGRKPI
ncbi:hypothetical protein MCOR02_008377 [Pyricularia oryzae]|uniref:Uncharacterized protein n=1 Tax=Pyricularia grisea TaxID=148305 RepID=A0ABQ8NNB8_PYRGI|nr:hypothetical protein MCOR02_008377 [Pyricularia oryzae]KAI6299657.1 hypothetical protein MCOR33_004466 [Pyricularia grisea]KAI6283796.1 hypothetical protein MCOR26_002201 [Pyricularia oryzae]KAI6308277.1 hypothetical protein MCOR29_009358 [Pyricularia oryzae]KAI6371055.1 hypothetical protein MCOR31_004327 [Pyricularia oryzae]